MNRPISTLSGTTQGNSDSISKTPLIDRAVAARKMKVLHVGKFYPPHMGGIETHLQTLCGELRKSVDLQVVVSNDHDVTAEEDLNGVKVTRVATGMTLASTPLCPGMIAKLRGSESDIIHLHFPNPMAVFAYMASQHKGRLVVTYHSDMVRQKFLGAMFTPFLHAVLRRSSAIIATSPNYVESSSVLAQYRGKCEVIPLGIPLQDFDNGDPARVAALRQQYGDRLIVSVGRLVYYKGFEYLIRAMTHVQGRLLIVGEGPLSARLNALAAELGVADRVTFLGKIDHQSLVACYHAARVFALASVARSEAFGISQVEAMAAGLPVVNTRLDSGVPYVSLHDQTGLTVPPDDAEALAHAINRLLNNEDMRLRFGAAARLRAHQEFSVDVMVARTLSLYDKVMLRPD